MFDAESLVPCLLQQVVPLVTNHVDAETITEDPKVRNSIIHFGPLFSYLGSYPLKDNVFLSSGMGPCADDSPRSLPGIECGTDTIKEEFGRRRNGTVF